MDERIAPSSDLADGKDSGSTRRFGLHVGGAAVLAVLLACAGWSVYDNIVETWFSTAAMEQSADESEAPPLAKADRLPLPSTGLNPSVAGRHAAEKTGKFVEQHVFAPIRPIWGEISRVTVTASPDESDGAAAIQKEQEAVETADLGSNRAPDAGQETLGIDLVPLPRARPRIASSRRAPPTVILPMPKIAETAAKEPGLLEKIFGGLKPATAMAYASADPGVTGLEGRTPIAGPQPLDRFTAVYDISAKTVYMPDGTRLEAHSGLGARMDDPRYVASRMVGPTPPHLYDLAPREALFHGVAALRLKPVGGSAAIHGRTGLLAHSFMLGPRGDSNGCVSFRNYDAFLQAYRQGKIKRLAVIAGTGRTVVSQLN